MKIMMFGHKHIPSREGGVEVVVTELAARMASRGHGVTCCSRGGKTGIYRSVVCRAMPVLPGKGLAAVSSSFFAGIFSAFSSADVVHIHSEGPAFWCWLPKLTGKRVVVTIHGLDWQREKWKGGLGAAFIRAGERMAVRFADEVIVLSRCTQRYFAEKYRRRTVYIPNGIPPAAPRKADKICGLGLEKDQYLLFLGRLVPEKGIHYLIEAFQELQTTKKLVIAGASSDTDGYVSHLKEMASRNERIVFPGFVSGRMLEELYSNAYCYILPSDLEGMPLTLLEAMSYGNCCVTSDIPECTEVMAGSGVVFLKGNVAELRSALENLCDHPERVEQYRRAAAKAVRDLFGWDKIVERTLEQYDENSDDQ